MAGHLGYEQDAAEGRGSGNSRNETPKTVTTEIGRVDLAVPRDRAGTLAPVTPPKHQRRLDGPSQNVISLDAKGLTLGESQAHLEEVYDTEESRETLSKITDENVADMAVWQNRPLDAVHPVLLIDAIVVKVRDAQVANRPVYVAITAPTVDDAVELPGALLGGLKGREVHLSHTVGALRRRHEHRTPCLRELAPVEGSRSDMVEPHAVPARAGGAGPGSAPATADPARHRTAHAAGRAQVTALVAAHRPDLAVPPRRVFGGVTPSCAGPVWWLWARRGRRRQAQRGGIGDLSG